MPIPLRVDPTDGREGLCLGEQGPWLKLRPPAVGLVEGGLLQAPDDGFAESGVDGLVVRHRLPRGLELRRHWRHRGLPPGAVASFVELHQGGDGSLSLARLLPWEGTWAQDSLRPHRESLSPEGIRVLHLASCRVAMAWLGPQASWLPLALEAGLDAEVAFSPSLPLGPGALGWGPSLLLWALEDHEAPESTWLQVQSRAQELGLA